MIRLVHVAACVCSYTGINLDGSPVPNPSHVCCMLSCGLLCVYVYFSPDVNISDKLKGVPKNAEQLAS